MSRGGKHEGAKPPKGERWLGGKHRDRGCLGFVAVPVVAALAFVVRAFR